MYTCLITPAQLSEYPSTGQALMVFDCSFDLMNPEAGTAQFLEQRIPGAVHAHLDELLSDKTGPDRASGGRHPLPSRETLARRLGALGFEPGMQAVVYDRQGANYCGRLWWMLKWCGHEAVAVLDGGLPAWLAEGRPTTSGPATPPEPRPPLPLHDSLARTLNTADILARLGHQDLTLLDARGAPRFRGETEPLDPVAGHIPGALNRPFGSNLGPDGRFKPAEQLRAEFLALLGGRDPASVVHHCGSGVSAIPNLLGMEIAGLGRTALYPGSWSEWCNTPGAPCARSQVG